MADIKMRNVASKILFFILIFSSLVAAFYAGSFVGSANARKQDTAVLNQINDSTGVYAFVTLDGAMKDLRNSKVAEADAIILRYAKLQLPKVLSCSQSEICSKSVGSAMPGQADIDYIRSMAELVPGN